MYMRYFVLFFVIFCAVNPADAQYGIRLKMNRNTYDDWTQSMQLNAGANEKIFRYGPELGLDYWFRLKKRRVEFMPEITVGTSSTNYGQDERIAKVDLLKFGFNFHTQIYALDLEGDCNCPTFSKQGPSINKGLFFHLTPGIEYHSYSITLPLISSAIAPGTNSVVGKIGLGMGLDLGISDLITITPQVSYYYLTKIEWDTFVYLPETNPSQLQFSVRLGLRNDYAKNGRRR
jgi:hypothetical protein